MAEEREGLPTEREWLEGRLPDSQEEEVAQIEAARKAERRGRKKAEAQVEQLTKERDEARKLVDLALDAKVERQELAKRYREALERNEVDARWIVGQWQRLRDQRVNYVAKEIVKRCRAALDKST